MNEKYLFMFVFVIFFLSVSTSVSIFTFFLVLFFWFLFIPASTTSSRILSFVITGYKHSKCFLNIYSIINSVKVDMPSAAKCKLLTLSFHSDNHEIIRNGKEN